MGRRKLTLQLIPNEKARMLTFARRKKGLLKKAKEFSILCGVDTCVIVYGTPVITDRPHEPQIFPADPAEVRRIIDKYYTGHGAKIRSFGLSDFFVNRKKKLDTELVKARSAVWEAKYPVSDDVVENFSEEELRPLLAVLGDRLMSAKKRLAELKEKEEAVAAASRDADINNMKDKVMSTPVAAAEIESDFRQHIPSHCSFYTPMPVHMKFPFQPGQYDVVPAPPAVPELPAAGYHGTGLFCCSNNNNSINIPHQYYGHQAMPTQHDLAAQSDPQLAGHYDQMHNCFSGSQHHHHQYYNPNMVGGIFPTGMLQDQGDMFGNVNNNFGGGLYNYDPSSSISSAGPTPYYNGDVSVMNHQLVPDQVHQWGMNSAAAAAADHHEMMHANHYIH